MNKKLMAVAVAGALAAPVTAFAQASNVQIYGRINTGWDNYSATGSSTTYATTGGGAAGDFRSRARVFDSGSRFGVRGTEDLGNGLKAIFQIESGVNIDTGTVNGQSAAANASSGVFASRDSFAGIAGNWGQLTFGRQSYFWSGAGVNDQIAANYINTGVPWSNNANFSRIAGPAARQSNTMQYRSPMMGGFSFMGNYSPNSEANAVNTATDANIWGMTIGYTNGPFDMHYDFASNQAVSGGATRQRVTGTKIDFGWAYQPGARVAVIWGRNKSDQSGGVTSGVSFTAGDNLAQSQWTLNWEHTFGNIMAIAQWGRLGSVSGCTAAAGLASCTQTGATAWTLAARYNMSKRTALYASYAVVNNEGNQWNDFAAGGMSSAAATGLGAANAGADPRIWALGLHHSF